MVADKRVRDGIDPDTTLPGDTAGDETGHFLLATTIVAVESGCVDLVKCKDVYVSKEKEEDEESDEESDEPDYVCTSSLQTVLAKVKRHHRSALHSIASICLATGKVGEGRQY